MPNCMAWLVLLPLLWACGDGARSLPADSLRVDAQECLDSCDYTGAVRDALALIDRAEATGDRVLEADGHVIMADSITVSAFYSYVDLAGEYSHDDNDSARIVMESARALIPKGDAEIRNQYELLYSDICRVREDFGDALRHIHAIDRTWLSGIITPADSVHIGEIYFRNSMPDSAALYFGTEAAADDIQYWECMAERSEAQDDLEAALAARKKMQDLEFDRSATALANSLEFVERSHYARKAADEKARRERLVAGLLWGAAALAVAALVWMLLHYSRRARRYKTESDMKDVVMIDAKTDSMADVSAAQPADAGTGSPAADAALDDKWIYVILDFYMSRLNGISREYFRTPDEQGRREIEAEFNRELKSLREGDIFEEIEQRVNDRHEGVMRDVRRDFPRFNEQYLRLMLCSLAGLSSQSTCLLLSIEKGNYYVMWTRIRAKIRISESPRRELYESLFISK